MLLILFLRIGIGNVVGRNTIEIARKDNMNMFGSKGKDFRCVKPYCDYTGYTPVNSATSVKDPTRWQPDILERGVDHIGAFVSQQFLTPQLSNVKTFTFKSDINNIVIHPPGRYDKVRIHRRYSKD